MHKSNLEHDHARLCALVIMHL